MIAAEQRGPNPPARSPASAFFRRARLRSPSSGVAARAEKTSSSGSYLMMPVSALTSRIRVRRNGAAIVALARRPRRSRTATCRRAPPAPRRRCPPRFSPRSSRALVMEWRSHAHIRGRLPNGMRPPCTCIWPCSTQACSVGNTLPGLSRSLPSKAHFSAFLLLEIGLGEHLAHQRLLLDADAMLAGEHAAHRDAELQDVGAEGFGALELARRHHVEHDQADADCRRRHGTRCSSRADSAPRAPRSSPARRQARGAGSSRPCTAGRA